ncbi:hypothetical protein KIKIMORA_00500 [Brevundimonas phage vB_BpoS-Kikimora]|uniref:Uncharacterized protein n=1 Tax=Brevundimonas phage vB_BpoS-Kikimora TaxID=2948601 RepID=A0A9E7MSD8_9CAUD|nr:hypothetical protein KIKIMORA_00500 [Brevundimonas phage vB_BpoS-Kikimora]
MKVHRLYTITLARLEEAKRKGRDAYYRHEAEIASSDVEFYTEVAAALRRRYKTLQRHEAPS